MGRKIPGKKHKGVKDPEKQRAKRQSELETKINAPPKNIDEQETPKSLERLIKLKNAVKSGALARKKRKRSRGTKLIQIGAQQGNSKLYGKAKPEKIVPLFKQQPGESNDQFYHRVSRETQAFIKETQFEAKFNVDVKRSAETGDIERVVKRPKDELDEVERLKKKSKNIGKKKKLRDANNEPKLTKTQKKKLKLLEKKQKKSENELDGFEKFSDKVEFGDIVHAPPVLKVLPKNVEKTEKRVKNKDLLLNSILQENQPSKNGKIINRAGKRKDLPIGERRQLEKQQSDAVAAYRLLKARKFGETAIPS